MQFEIGQKIWSIGFDLINKKDNTLIEDYYFQAPIPHLFSIEKIHFIPLTVSEHRIFEESKTGLKYDDYTLISDLGVIYRNKFSDSTPLLLRFTQSYIFNNDDLNNFAENHPELNYQELINQYKGFYRSTQDIVYFLNNLDGGVLDENMKTKVEREFPDTYQELSLIAERIKQEFHVETGLNLVRYNKSTSTRFSKIRTWKIEN